MLNVTGRTIRTWEAGEVPEYAVKRVARLAILWEEPELPPDHYALMSDAALLAEMTKLLGVLGQRLADREAALLSPDTPELDDTPEDVRQDTPELYDVSPGDEQSTPNPTAPPRRIRGRGPRRT